MEVAIAAYAKRQCKTGIADGVRADGSGSAVSLQRAVLSLIPDADAMSQYQLRMNPHLWCNDSTYAVYRDPNLRTLKPWNREWPKLELFLQRHPGLVAGDLLLAYHGTPNRYNVSRILFAGLDPKCRRFTPLFNKAYFGTSAEACRQHGDIVLFVVPKSAVTICNGDGVFSVNESDALPIGTYQKPSDWNFGDLFSGSQ